MKTTSLALIGLAFLFCLPSAPAQWILLDTGTRGNVDLDFDGAVLETALELGITVENPGGITEKIFTLTGSDIPNDPIFASILSLTITFTASGGVLSADQGGINPIGIGISSQEDSTAAERSLISAGIGELLTISVSSTSSVPGQEIRIAGVNLASWRDQFPVSQVTFSGATIGGSASVLGNDLLPAQFPLIFDSSVNSVSITSTGADDFRLSGVAFGVVPEPTSAALLTAGLLAIAGRRRCGKLV